MQKLDCFQNQLASLDLSNNLDLKRVDCFENQLSTLNFNQNPNLLILEASNNLLTNLDINQITSFKSINCGNNQLTSLDLSYSFNLTRLVCDNNLLSNLDISQNLALRYLNCGYNQLTNLDVVQNLNLSRVDCNNNQLTTLNVTQNESLTTLFCNDNQLTSLLIKNNNISWGYPNGNNTNGIALDFSNNFNLQYICSDDDDILMLQQKVVDYGYTNCNINSYCSFEPGGNFYEIIGNTIFDYNEDGCDLNDFSYKNLNFNFSNGTITNVLISSQSGNFYIPVQAGSHTITPNLEDPTYFTISPTSFTVDFPTQVSPFTQDFCVTANGNHSDVEVVILPTTPARPGFDAKYKIIYRNKGNQIENGAVTFTYNDAVLDYIAANPVYDSQATDSFVWNYTNLQPFETREIEVVLNVNSPMEIPAVNNGDQLNFLAEITPMVNDEVLFDNTSSLKQTVVGSYDPNDKTCLEGETVGPDMIGEYVHYLIRFENTGTYPAENVVVKDMIDLAKFDFATLIPLKGSHDFYTRIKDNKVEFIFENINLDFNDATNDGYVAFKIKTKSNLTVGSAFSNNANIYFDYNFPITTNTYTTTIQALSSQDFDFGNQFILYPNPVKDVLHFNSKENLDIKSVEIYNMLGQIVVVVPNATTSIDVSSLTNGNYFVKINTEKGSATTKFIKE